MILAIPPSQLRTWMLCARDSGMTSGDYVFIFLNNEIPSAQLAADWSGDATWKQNSDDDDDAREAFQNLIVVQKHELLL